VETRVELARLHPRAWSNDGLRHARSV
jgi:hypothetical protein